MRVYYIKISLFVLFVIFSISCTFLYASDLILDESKIYVIFRGEKGEVVYWHGNRYELGNNAELKLEVIDYENDLKSYASEVEIVLKLYKKGVFKSNQMDVSLLVSPYIGLTKEYKDPEMGLNWEEIKKTATWFMPEMVETKQIIWNSDDRATVKFRWNFENYLNKYFDLNLQVLRIRFDLSISPNSEEIDLKNNNKSINIGIPTEP